LGKYIKFGIYVYVAISIFLLFLSIIGVINRDIVLSFGPLLTVITVCLTGFLLNLKRKGLF
jgi:hypothetical protein